MTDHWRPKVGERVVPVGLARGRLITGVSCTDEGWMIRFGDSHWWWRARNYEPVHPRADEPSVDEMLNALGEHMLHMEPCESKSRPWATWCVVTDPGEGLHHETHFGETPTAAIRAAHKAITEESQP